MKKAIHAFLFMILLFMNILCHLTVSFSWLLFLKKWLDRLRDENGHIIEHTQVGSFNFSPYGDSQYMLSSSVLWLEKI